ncbi:GNAT family N-acetyltransferase [Corynebacterium lowii]|uniref:Putative ribosomal N-acetyltransferase YdaF n=1 Tax=Corynebacterium lowii TaxID=1544413 RepID=A0A0Q0UM06_9CORY|nr:GNAT family N-acetyltransferase [Corynebacterium lowii]KQB87446.1 putative ribosomal N-acetyltransferase YdaF [Corynebacterium lowii]MDP9851962.1 RimJ/RimL family protein N-acetyltransferase [Corynebacterium lowii]
METKRLILRPWQEEDSAELFRYASDPLVGPRAGWPVHESVEDSRASIAGVLSEPGTYAIVLKETGLPIGSISLHTGSATELTDSPDEAELGYWVGVPYWGQGIMHEAARRLIRYAVEEQGITVLWCSSNADNAQSQRVQEKLGFRPHSRTQGKEGEQGKVIMSLPLKRC